jgi:hypothetical protein
LTEHIIPKSSCSSPANDFGLAPAAEVLQLFAAGMVKSPDVARPFYFRAAQSSAEVNTIWSRTCPKIGMVTPIENRCSSTS